MKYIKHCIKQLLIKKEKILKYLLNQIYPPLIKHLTQLLDRKEFFLPIEKNNQCYSTLIILFIDLNQTIKN